jgi:hypothetical protein
VWALVRICVTRPATILQILKSKSRIFKVLKTLVPHEEQPVPLDRLLGYEFFNVDPDTGRPREFRIEFGPDAHQNYLTKLYDLAYEIAEFLKLMDNSACDQQQTSPKEPIFLAVTSSDLNEERNRAEYRCIAAGSA